MDTTDKLLALAAAVIVGATFFFVSAGPLSTAGFTAVPSKSQFVLYSDGDTADGLLTLKATKDIARGSTFRFAVNDNVLSEKPDERKARIDAGFDATQTRTRSLLQSWDFPYDFGTFAGAAPSARGPQGESSTFQVGLRVSPARFLYGTIAPDLLVTSDHFGVGLSLYPPPDLMGHSWAHWGIGYGHLWPTSQGAASNLFYLSFSTQIP